ncbi:MAG: quinoprotein dehydrogenase-associated putative ABC transporter substrate-binding protein [Candidatus Eremiobacteraeota bacterium]|nr:quinoprotein dehydrogenase-associated putative ABC transporter substrate-binding protein [Candidatus Eremiobacteraeota bacterium]MBV8643515.1 quinoprotein dehydrogenase-associated putative ABC transporter substrate-binding protein [Candidatus Eremiobacteraeota bacterium]
MIFHRLAVAVCVLLAATAVSPAPLRVCADPDYMPFSNRAGDGFENKIAAAMGHALGVRVQYTWASMRGPGGFDQFLHDTLNAGKCDVVIDVPYASDNVLATRPYYISSYVFIFPKKRNYDITSMDSPVLRQLKIGFESDTPAETGLKVRALILHAVPFDVGSDAGTSPSEVLDAVTSGKVAVAVTWEPAVGYYLRSRGDLRVVAVPNSRSMGAPEQYAFPMAMGARHGDTKTRDALDGAIARNKGELTRILETYGVKLYQSPLDVGLAP